MNKLIKLSSQKNLVTTNKNMKTKQTNLIHKIYFFNDPLKHEIYADMCKI